MAKRCSTGRRCRGNLSHQDTKDIQKRQGTPGDSGDSEAEGSDKDWPHHLQMSPTYGECLLNRGTNKWSKSDGSLRCGNSDMGIFMSVTLQAAVHLGKDYTENLRSTKNQPLKSAKQVISNDWELDHGSDRKLLDWPRLTGRSLCGKRLLC